MPQWQTPDYRYLGERMHGPRLHPATAFLAVALACSLAFARPADALNFVVEPLYPPERSMQVHKPLIDYLRDGGGYPTRRCILDPDPDAG